MTGLIQANRPGGQTLVEQYYASHSLRFPPPGDTPHLLAKTISRHEGSISFACTCTRRVDTRRVDKHPAQKDALASVEATYESTKPSRTRRIVQNSEKIITILGICYLMITSSPTKSADFLMVVTLAQQAEHSNLLGLKLCVSHDHGDYYAGSQSCTLQWLGLLPANPT